MSVSGPTGSERRPRLWVREVVVGVVVAVLSAVVVGLLGLDRSRSSAPRPPVAPPPRPTRLTWDHYKRIKPGMKLEEVQDLLGSGGQVVAEEGVLVDAKGRYHTYRRGGGGGYDETGTLREHDGAGRREVRQVIRWTAQDRWVEVTVLNEQVAEKREHGVD